MNCGEEIYLSPFHNLEMESDRSEMSKHMGHTVEGKYSHGGTCNMSHSSHMHSSLYSKLSGISSQTWLAYKKMEFEEKAKIELAKFKMISDEKAAKIAARVDTEVRMKELDLRFDF